MTTPDLKRYREKRDPARTPEPFGGVGGRALPPAAPRAFVVQQHAARRTHWDLRLEVDGVLASWAVPKGPSLDPAQRRLAVRTEDHPLDYAHFEGVIPEGNYGAGAMIVWDAGAYRTHHGEAPAAGLEEGKLDLELLGHKLRGRFALVRTGGGRGDGRSWLLIAKGGPPAEAGEVVEREPGSVLSGLTVEELAAGDTRDAQVEELQGRLRAPRRALCARDLRPMLATSVDVPFSREGWLFELKYDGVRVVATKDAEARVGLTARSGRDVTALYPEVARALRRLPLAEFAIDGELVAPDERGVASFERIQRRFTQVDAHWVPRLEVEFPVLLYAFDCLSALGRDLRGLPLVRRKELLSLFCPRLGQVRFADHVEGDGLALFEAARERALEGIVAKRADSRYESGRRSKAWRKVKVPRSACLAVVGLLPGRGSRAALGSVMLAWHRDGELRYAGNAGSGLGEGAVREILDALADRVRSGPAFEGAPDPPPRGASFVEPALTCEVRYSEVTSAGLLRHPVFVRLRPDVTPGECRAPALLQAEPRPEHPASDGPSAQAPAEPLQLTRLDKVFWPVEGFTKGDLLAYYEAVWPWLAPYLRDRPVVLTRYPDGIEGKSFYQKNAPEFTPDWVERCSIDDTDYFLCNDLRTLLYVVNSGAIPLHVWHARVGQLDRPDWLVLDLDPKEAPFAHVVRIARHLHALLRELGAAHFVKTSGQAGLHVLLPLDGSLSHEESRALAEVIARCVCAELPEIATVARPLAARADKVYVDFLQNGRGKLIASPLSVRPRPGAPVSMPLFWTQVSARLDPARWNIRSAVRQLERRGDPFRGVLGEGVEVPALLARLERRVRRRES